MSALCASQPVTNSWRFAGTVSSCAASHFGLRRLTDSLLYVCFQVECNGLSAVQSPSAVLIFALMPTLPRNAQQITQPSYSESLGVVHAHQPDHIAAAADRASHRLWFCFFFNDVTHVLNKGLRLLQFLRRCPTRHDSQVYLEIL